jgi:hypothetical protein
VRNFLDALRQVAPRMPGVDPIMAPAAAVTRP